MDIVTYVLSKAYSDRTSSDLQASLQNSIDEVKAQLDEFMTAMASGMLYKGAVETIGDLPTEDVKIGDVYTVKEDQGEYVWTGEEWFELGEDLTDEFAAKQDKLTAGTNIEITDDAVISSKEEVQAFDNLSSFPAEGQASTIYIAKDTMQPYAWDEATAEYSAIRVELTSINSSYDYVIDGGNA